MTPSDPAPATADLVVVEDDLADHVVDLLAAAGIAAVTSHSPQGRLSTIAVPAAQLHRARATLDLVLPGVLGEESGELRLPTEPPRLSGRLIRRSDWTSDAVSDDPVQPPRSGLVDGRAAFADSLQPAEWDQGPAATEPVDDGDYLPPEPPPIPHGDPVSRFAWLGAVGGPILMLLTALLNLPSILAAAGLTAFVVGFGVLVARMPNRAPQDDGWDDGAVL
jgi:hypothetical protein